MAMERLIIFKGSLAMVPDAMLVCGFVPLDAWKGGYCRWTGKSRCGNTVRTMIIETLA